MVVIVVVLVRLVVVIVVVLVRLVVVIVVMLMLLVVMMMVMAGAVGVIALRFAVGLQCFQCGLQRILLLHGLHKLLTGELLPWGGDDHSRGVLFPEHGHSGLKLILFHIRRSGEDNGSRIFNLVVIKFAKVLHVDLALGGVCHGYHAADLHILGFGTLYGLRHIAELANAGGLDENTVRMVFLHDLFQGLAKVTYQRAADAAGVHLRDLNAGLLQKAAIDTDLAELIFDEHDFLTGIDFLNQLFDERGLTSTQKTGENIYFCHNQTPSVEIWGQTPTFSIYYNTSLQVSAGIPDMFSICLQKTAPEPEEQGQKRAGIRPQGGCHGASDRET